MAENFPPDTEYLTIPQLCERWSVSPSKLHRLIEDRHLAAVRVDGVLRIPAEFAGAEEPLNSLRGTLLALQDAGFDTDEAVAWLLNENDELGERPVAALLAGRKSAVRRATQSLAF
ncbi:MAG: DNA-binding protein [Leucobacter sp.]|nr:DNA-binding protein [Leucobacter sp.]